MTDHPPKRREEDDKTVAKKGRKRSTTKKAASKSPKAVRRPAIKVARKTTAPSKPASATARPAPPSAGPTLGDHAEHLRGEILRSKHTHPDPWRYAPKARAWGERVQVLVEQIAARGETPAARRSLEALDVEVRGDRDFQEARRLF